MVDHAAQEIHWGSVSGRRRPDHPAVRAFAEPKIDLITSVLTQAALPQRARVVEVGSGNGFFSVLLAKHYDVVCSDFSPNMLAMSPLARDRKVAADAEALSFATDSAEVVFSANLLHHLEDPLQAVREMQRVATRHVVLIEPNALNPAMFLFSLIKSEERGGLKFTPGYMDWLAQESGLRPRCRWSHGSVVPNKTPLALLPLLRLMDGCWPLALYHVAILDV
jgi:SAM-dependent methyltransferase